MTTASVSARGLLESDPLCKTFTAMARKIWRQLGQARAVGINRGEETVTDDFLLEVQEAHPAEVSTFQFNKHQEAIIGADWEWWLTDGRKWAGLLIQAKILNPKSNLYSAIKHNVRGRPQIDIILQQAAHKGIPALYFLYNHTRLRLSDLNWNCRSTDPQIEQLGCTVAHAAALKPLVKQGGVGIVTLGAIAVPLRCLVCCRGHVGPNQSPSLPARAHGVVRYLAEQASEAPAVEVPPLRLEPPRYVRELISTPIDQRHRVIERMRSEIGPIGSLIVVKDLS